MNEIIMVMWVGASTYINMRDGSMGGTVEPSDDQSKNHDNSNESSPEERSTHVCIAVWRCTRTDERWCRPAQVLKRRKERRYVVQSIFVLDVWIYCIFAASLPLFDKFFIIVWFSINNNEDITIINYNYIGWILFCDLILLLFLFIIYHYSLLLSLLCKNLL